MSSQQQIRTFTKVDESTESFRNFISKFRNSPKTKQDFTTWLKMFVKYCNSDVGRARIKIEINDNTDLLLFDSDTRKIQTVIKQFIDHLYSQNLSPSTVRSYYLAVKQFYQSNEITLNWPVIKDYMGIMNNVKRDYDMPYTYEEIHKLLDKSEERQRCIVLLLCSSGMRRGGLHELKYGDLKWIEQYQIYEITVYKGFKEEYITYCSMECASSINSYLDFRRRNGEIITKDSYLIRKQFDTRNKQGLIKISDARDPPEKHKITMRNLESIVYRLIYDAGIRNYDEKKTRLGDRHINMASHSFRKFFENKCLESGIDPFYVSAMMGHRSKGIGVERHYFRPSSIHGEFSLLELYVKKAAPFLTISEENRLKLKNQELEMRIQADTSRIREAETSIREALEKSLREREKKDYDIIASMGDRINELSRELTELKKEGMKNNK
ncbi:MAG TPA: site-specific integrase [Nitrososphaeraceae archaeon]|nr:site-specific integrase [Nitrososphaeraceae archaeon]